MSTFYEMRLHARPFSMIESGKKTIELRLLDEKRQKIRVGDTVRFTQSGNDEKTLLCKVVALHTFPSFAALYASLPLEKCGYTQTELPTANPADMEEYYSKAEQARYGVVGIEIQVL